MEDYTRSELRKALLFGAAACALLLVVLAYRQALDAGFIWDDHTLAERDAPFRHVSLLKLFTSPFWPASPLSDARAQYYYRPVVLLSLRADLALGDDPGGFHFTNLLLHLVACALVAIVAVRAGARASAGILAALVWGLAPRLSESVAWIAGRTDVLATMFGLGALALSPALDASRNGRLRHVRAIAAAACLFLALASKEVAVAFAVAIVAAHAKRGPWRGWWASATREVGVPIALWIGLRIAALDPKEKQPLRDLGLVGRAGTVCEAVERYVEMTFDALRPRTSIGLVGDVDRARAVIGVLLVVALIAVFVHAMKRGGLGARIGAVIAAVAIAPVLHVIPFALSGGVAADRLLYAPLAGLAIALACTGTTMAPLRQKSLAAVALVVTVFFSWATRARTADYATEGRFWLTAAENAHPRNAMPLRSLAAYAELSEARALGCRLYERARERANDVAIVGPSAHRRTLEALASCWIKLGRYDDGRALLEDVARLHPTHARVWMELGYAREHTSDFGGARAAFAQAASLDPALAPMIAAAQKNLAGLESATVRFADPAARTEDPFGYAELLAHLGHLPEAQEAYFAVTRDAKVRADLRFAAAWFVVDNGRLADAESLVAVYPDFEAHVAPRRKRHAVMQRLTPEIEALLAR